MAGHCQHNIVPRRVHALDVRAKVRQKAWFVDGLSIFRSAHLEWRQDVPAPFEQCRKASVRPRMLHARDGVTRYDERMRWRMGLDRLLSPPRVSRDPSVMIAPGHRQPLHRHAHRPTGAASY